MSYKPLLPFTAGSASSSSSSTPVSFPSSPALKSYNANTPARPGWIPPKKLLLPLVLLGLASYAFVSSTQTNYRVLEDGTALELESLQAHVPNSATTTKTPTNSNPRYREYTESEMRERWERSTKPLPTNATTSDRLKEWENTLVEIEAGEWVAKNLETCPESRIRPNQNGQMIDKSHLIWASMSSKKILGMRKEMADFIREKEREGALERYGEGRGLVFTAGNADTFSRVLTTLKLLHRHLHSPLPSEIFSFPGETPNDQVRQELQYLNATLRTVESATRDRSRTKNFHLKARAIVDSSFREVLYLDSDNLPTASLSPRDTPIPKEVMELARKENRTDTPWTKANGEEIWGKPTGLWEGKAYKRLGVMFWPDYWRTSADNAIWAILGVPCRDEWEQEAGQILVDKKQHLDALLLADWMMDSSRFKYWFNFSDGDKDMFRFAFLALRKRWAVPGRYVSVGALPSNTMTGFCGTTMLQHDHLGKPLFVHANLMKQIPSGVYKGFAWGRSRQLRTQASTLTIRDRYDTSAQLEKEDPLTDDDVDCDMLANPSDDGIALGAVPPGRAGYRTRRRAVMEKGIRAGFHGGAWSALCIDYHYEDPRTGEQIEEAKLAVAKHMENPENRTLEELAKDVDVCYCAANDAFETRLCGEDLTEIVQWNDDPRLRDFEEAFFTEGGHLNAAGF
ncbi:uncharacterized protein JCM15063_004771 [Sporobolomyces koalae]|uniref:uncharacterized protein n=1 Tax=Sporobolomyces koalae TaxID=500713 RepID=UPI0031825A6E